MMPHPPHPGFPGMAGGMPMPPPGAMMHPGMMMPPGGPGPADMGPGGGFQMGAYQGP